MNIISCFFTVFISLVLPIIIAIWLVAKNKNDLKPILLGVLTFVVFQMFIRLPLLQLVFPRISWYVSMTLNQPMLFALFLGCSAALVEIGGRYLIMTLFMKNRCHFHDGIAFGIGHGGIEAVLLVGVNTLLMLFISGGSQNTAITFAAGVERLSTMIMQIAWSVMVLKSIREKKIGWTVLAFVLHALIDTSVGLVSLYSIPIYLVEIVLGALAFFMLLFLFSENKKQRRLLL